MENASKALLITAGVFLGVMLLAVMIYVFRQGASINESYDNKQINLQLELYNSQFENFDRSNNNIIDVISLCNLAFDVNKECDFDKTSAVEVEIRIGTQTFKIPNTDLITERNTILKGSSKMSIYKLVESPLGGTDSLGISGYGDFTCSPTDKLSMTKLITDDKKVTKTIYKYLFKVADSKDFVYNPHNNKVIKIKLTAYTNPEW